MKNFGQFLLDSIAQWKTPTPSDASTLRAIFGLR
jgi:hypothetical protein